ncbi:MAG: hypothetical protein MRZ79_16195 [Bacteroidia bacterium]|nr:hypothetical protein [Bacteroidia bacterium]
MKNLRILLAVVLVATMVFSCQTPENQIQPDENNIETAESTEVKHFELIHNAEEADRMIYSKYKSLDFTAEEKLNLMTDLVAEQFFSRDAAAARTDQYVFVAQIFILGQYYTDVATFSGTPTGNLTGATVSRSDSGNGGVIGFVGANANVYLNGNNIKGNITFEPFLDCSDWYLESDCFASARWSASSGAYTAVYVECFID